MTTEELRDIDKKVAIELGWKWQNPPWYSTDPADADLVRLEIERRGWDWYSQCSHTGKGICYEATVGHPEWPESYRKGVFADRTKLSTDSPHVALCLAFLAACEASKQ